MVLFLFFLLWIECYLGLVCFLIVVVFFIQLLSGDA
jgi:hypothetical protein